MNKQVEQRYLVNKTFDEIHIGDSASLTRTLMPEDVKLFAILTGDVNPAVVDPKFSESGMFREVIAHGMWSGSLISTVLGTQFPGPGTILVDQSLHFARPVTIGDQITITITAKQKFEHNKHVVFDCVCTNQEGLQVVRGKAEVLAPLEKVSRLQEVHMPEIRIDDKHERYTHLLERVKGLEPIPTAVAHPCDAESLKGPVMAFQAGIIIGDQGNVHHRDFLFQTQITFGILGHINHIGTHHRKHPAFGDGRKTGTVDNDHGTAEMGGNATLFGRFHGHDTQLVVIGMSRADMIHLGLFKKRILTAGGHIDKLIRYHKIAGFHVKLQTANATGRNNRFDTQAF